MTITLNKWQLALVRKLLFRYLRGNQTSPVYRGIAQEILIMTEEK